MRLRLLVASAVVALLMPKESEAQCVSYPNEPTCQVVMVGDPTTNRYWGVINGYAPPDGAPPECSMLMDMAYEWGDPQWTIGFPDDAFYDHTNGIYGMDPAVMLSTSDAAIAGLIIHEMAHASGMFGEGLPGWLQEACT